MVVAAAFGLRVAAALVTEAHPIFPLYYYADARLMDDAARSVYDARNEGRDYYFTGTLSQRLQISLQAALYRAVGPRPLAAKLTNAALGALSIGMLGLLLAPIFGARAALATAAFVAVWPSHIFYTAQNFKESPTNLLAYGGMTGALALLTDEPRPLWQAAVWASATTASLVAAGFYRSYILLAIVLATTTAYLWTMSSHGVTRARALGLAAVLLSAALYAPVAHFAYRRWFSAGFQNANESLAPHLIPVTNDDKISGLTHGLATPAELTRFRNIRQSEDRQWAENHYHREIGTQIFPDERFTTWLDVAAFVPKSAFYVLFMPLPGLYPMNGKLGRMFASAENVALLALALLAAAGAVRGPKTPARAVLLVFFAVMTTGAALLEFDLGSAGRHKLLYLPMLFPFAAEEIIRRLRPADRE